MQFPIFPTTCDCTDDSDAASDPGAVFLNGMRVYLNGMLVYLT